MWASVYSKALLFFCSDGTGTKQCRRMQCFDPTRNKHGTAPICMLQALLWASACLLHPIGPNPSRGASAPTFLCVPTLAVLFPSPWHR